MVETQQERRLHQRLANEMESSLIDQEQHLQRTEVTSEPQVRGPVPDDDIHPDNDGERSWVLEGDDTPFEEDGVTRQL